MFFSVCKFIVFGLLICNLFSTNAECHSNRIKSQFVNASFSESQQRPNTCVFTTNLITIERRDIYPEKKKHGSPEKQLRPSCSSVEMIKRFRSRLEAKCKKKVTRLTGFRSEEGTIPQRTCISLSSLIKNA